MRFTLPFDFSLDPFSFFAGFIIASIFWWVISRSRPLLKEISANIKTRQEETQATRATGVEEHHRRLTLRRAQGLHLASQLFALDEILLEPRLLAPPPRIEPGGAPASEDVTTLTLPYLPAWPELAATYNAPTLTLGQALAGGMNLIIIGQPGCGKSVALAHLASLAANRSETLGTLKDAVPFLFHVADLKLPVSDAKEALNQITEASAGNISVFDLARFPGLVQNSFRSGRALLLMDGFDELTPDGQAGVSNFLKLLLIEYPKLRVVTTGAPEYMDGLLSLRFVPLALAAWNKYHQIQFIQKWGQLWTQYVAVEAWAQSGPTQVDPLLLNAWLNTDNLGLTPFELTLKVWGAYAGDALGPHILEAIASHVRRLAPTNTPLAALETLAMQVTLTGQPVFEPRSARDWVKQFEMPDEIAAVTQSEGEGSQAEKSKDDGKSKKKKDNHAPAPTPGLLGRLASSGLIISHLNNKMRFAHPVIGGFLAGQALSGFKIDDVLLNQPDWAGKLLAMRYFAAYGDATELVGKMLEWSRLPMHRPMLTAARWLRDAPRDAPWRGKLMGSLAELMQSEGLPGALRGQALAAFTFSNDPGVSTMFRQLTNTLSFELMKLLALGSGYVGDAKAVRTLEGILQAPSLSARRAAILALVAIGTTEALETVAQTLLNADEDLRRASAEALANDPTEGLPMLKDGASMSDILVRRAVVYGLARVDEPWALELIQKLQVEDDQWVVRNSANEVLEARTHLNENPRIPRPLKAPSQTPWLI